LTTRFFTEDFDELLGAQTNRPRSGWLLIITFQNKTRLPAFGRKFRFRAAGRRERAKRLPELFFSA